MEQKKKIIIIYILILSIAFLGSFTYTYKLLFTPSKQDSIATVMIDAGHGGYDCGAIGADGVYEKDITLKIALQTGKLIEQMDSRIKVVYTRTDDDVVWPSEETEDLNYRINLSQSQNVDYFLSIHTNSCDNASATGYSFYIREDDTASLQISHNIVDNLKTVRWSNKEGISNTTNRSLYVVDQQSIPCILFEAGYISNKSECSKLQKWYVQIAISYSLAKGYVDYIQKSTDFN